MCVISILHDICIVCLDGLEVFWHTLLWSAYGVMIFLNYSIHYKCRVFQAVLFCVVSDLWDCTYVINYLMKIARFQSWSFFKEGFSVDRLPTFSHNIYLIFERRLFFESLCGCFVHRASQNYRSAHYPIGYRCTFIYVIYMFISTYGGFVEKREEAGSDAVCLTYLFVSFLPDRMLRCV